MLINPIAVTRSVLPLALLAAGGTFLMLRSPPAPAPPPPIVLEMPVPVVAVHTDPVPRPTTMCDDALAGTWVARTYRAEIGDWHEYQIRITRFDEVIGASINLRAWAAGPRTSAIPHCEDGTSNVEWHHITGHVQDADDEIRIDATEDVASGASSCGVERGYSLDHFSGHLTGDGILETVNNDDAGTAHDRPYTFHRVSCH